MESRASRVARGGIAGSFATGVAAVSHGVVHGSAPSALAVGLALVFSGMLGILLIGQKPSLPRLTVVVAGSQAAFHLVFSFLTPGTATMAADHHAVAQLTTGPTLHTDTAMWISHAIAGIATILFLRRAESGLWQLLRDAFRPLAVLFPAIEAPSADRANVPTVAPRHPVSVVFLTVVTHRGPPAAGFGS